MLKTITQVTFATEVLGSPNLGLVEYWSPTCGPCEMYNEVLEHFKSARFPLLKLFTVNVDAEIDVANQEGILVLPTTKLYLNGKCIKTISGVQTPDDLEKLLESLSDI